MKMYILVKRNVPDKLVPVISAHASLACFRKFEQDEDMQKWISKPHSIGQTTHIKLLLGL